MNLASILSNKCWPFVLLFVSFFFSLVAVYPQYIEDTSILLTREVASLILVPLLTIMLWFGKRASINVSVNNLAKIANHRRRRTTEQFRVLFLSILQNRLQRHKNLIVVIAVLTAFADLRIDVFYANTNVQIQSLNYKAVLFVLLVGFWLSLLNFALALYTSINLCKTCILKYSRIQLIEVEELAPLSNTVVANFLLVSIPMCFYPMYSIFTSMNTLDKYILLVLAIICLCWVIHPLFLIYRQLNISKQDAIATLNYEIKNQLKKSDQGLDHLKKKQRLVDSAARVQRLSDLLLLKKEILSVPYIPMDVPLAMKLSLLLLLPLFSWVGAGLLSTLINSVFG